MTKALIADSSIYWIHELSQLLGFEGVEVIAHFTQGKRWADVLRHQQPDFVFFDDQLYPENGLQTLEAYLEEFDFSGKFVFTHDFQGLDANLLEQSAMKTGADFCLPKPYRRQSLKRILQVSAKLARG